MSGDGPGELRLLAHHARTSPEHRRRLARALLARGARSTGLDVGPVAATWLLVAPVLPAGVREAAWSRGQDERAARRLVHARGPAALEAVRRLARDAVRAEDQGSGPRGLLAALAAPEGPAGGTAAAPTLADVDLALAAGHPGRARRLAGRLTGAGRSDPLVVRLLAREPDEAELLADGYPLTDPAPRRRPAAAAEAPVRYLLHNSLPRHSGGYATRSHGVLRALRGAGWHVEGLTRPGYDGGPRAEVDGVPYGRLPGPGAVDGHAAAPPAVPLARYVRAYADALDRHVGEQGVALLHAASNSWNGLAAAEVAARRGLPFVYEVRGLWELTRLSREPGFAATTAYRTSRALEVQAATAADHTFVLTEALMAELVRSGVPAERMSVLPNGVDAARFTPRPRDEELDERLGTRGRTVVGYVGSVVDYEGLEMLVAAAAGVRASGRDVVVLVVGDGAALPALRREVDRLGVADLVRLVGRVPHAEVERYYSLVDVVAFPRRPWPVCELVSPLKPFEAMAVGKAVVVSGVGALREIVTDGRTGLVHRPDDVDDLTDCLVRLVDDPGLRADLADRGRAWVRAERDWATLVTRVTTVYEQLLGGAPAPREAAP